MKWLIIAPAFAFVFFAGGYLGQATFEPQVIVKIVDRVVYEPVEVERIIVKEPQVIVETEIRYEVVVKEVPIKLHDFGSLEGLKEWLEGTPIQGPPNSNSDCGNYALRLQQEALKDGYLMSFEAIWPAEYNELFKETQLEVHQIHAINLVIIGNDVYYIEPQTKEVTLAGRLD